VTSNAQSQMSVETADSHCQMTPDVTDGTMQTERHDVEVAAQTELSTAWRADSEVQAVTAVSESAAQASVPVTIVTCQTDSSMANLQNRDVQAVVDMMYSESQTDIAQSDSEAQTEVCFCCFHYWCRNIFNYILFRDVMIKQEKFAFIECKYHKINPFECEFNHTLTYTALCIIK